MKNPAATAFAFMGLLCVGSAIAQPKTIDMAGVTPGMTLIDARAALAAFNPAFQFLELTEHFRELGDKRVVVQLLACRGRINREQCQSTGDTTQDFESVLVAFGHRSGKAYFISRTWMPAKTTRPLLSAAKAGVTAKYGAIEDSLSMSANQGLYVWDFNNTGQRVCGWSRFTEIPTQAYPTCAVTLRILLTKLLDERESPFLGQWRGLVYDHRLSIENSKLVSR